ncbi:MAG TPA: ABC transporter permease [Candidatus Eisenbergiella merdipullorum]|uniref:Transport permease protein n=1 Tax=Candidatus Eisenbergiella merdipullorum TaxID=2838553 RepID=A0A9D2L210_9FIRM|nr:ABC transporter permease [Candidatus Eisenbergiella merdipullorum]
MKKLKELKQYIFVVRQLVAREIKRKYSRSYLGIVWSVLNPLMNMVVLSIIFTKMFSRSIENYPLYLLSGQMIWQLFTGATNAAMTVMVDNRVMLTRVKFPMGIFPVARVYSALVNYMYTFIAYLLILAVFRIPPSLTMLLAPVIVLCVTLFSLGLGYLLAVVYVFFADIRYLYSVLLSLWMYCSALFYPVDALPEVMSRVVKANPVYNYIACMRGCMLYASWPTQAQWARMFLWAAGAFLLGYLVFQKSQNRIMQSV